MKKFVVTYKLGTGDQIEFMATDYVLKDGFFSFIGADGSTLAMVSADVVKSIVQVK